MRILKPSCFRSLLRAYIVWAVLNTLFVLWVSYVHSLDVFPAIVLWLFIHVAPFSVFQVDFYIITGLLIMVVISGLLIRRSWARFLIIAGVSAWFLWGMCIAGIGF